MEIPFSPEEIKKAILETIKVNPVRKGGAFTQPSFLEKMNAITSQLPKRAELSNGVNEVKDCYIRPIFFGYGKMGLDPTGVPVNVAIAVWPWKAYLGKEIVSVKISKFIRIHPLSTIPDAKLSGHYLNSIFATLEAKKGDLMKLYFWIIKVLLLKDRRKYLYGRGEMGEIIKRIKKFFTQIIRGENEEYLKWLTFV